jgi:hypothetical protein
MDPDPIWPERIVEVWFPSDHANIGGGWATDRLSDITLDFLLRHISSGYATAEQASPGPEDWGVYLAARKADKLDVACRTDCGDDEVAIVDPDYMGQVRAWFSRLLDSASGAYAGRIADILSNTVSETTACSGSLRGRYS